MKYNDLLNKYKEAKSSYPNHKTKIVVANNVAVVVDDSYITIQLTKKSIVAKPRLVKDLGLAKTTEVPSIDDNILYSTYVKPKGEQKVDCSYFDANVLEDVVHKYTVAADPMYVETYKDGYKDLDPMCPFNDEIPR